MPTMYLDLLLILNGFVDCLLLSAVAALLHLPHRRWRLLCGAAAGAVSSLVILLPALAAPTLVLYDVLTAAVMVAVAFPFTGRRRYAHTVLVLFLLSALFSGLCYLLWLFVAPGGFFVFNGTVYYDVSPLALLLSTLFCYGVIRVFEFFSARAPAPRKTFSLIAENRGQTVLLTALYDTGFSVVDGFSGNPVVLVDKAAVSPLLPADFGAAGSGFRLVPCHTVTGDGLLYAFCPDRLLLKTPQGDRPLSGTLLALSDQMKNEPFNALCGEDVAKLSV